MDVKLILKAGNIMGKHKTDIPIDRFTFDDLYFMDKDCTKCRYYMEGEIKCSQGGLQKIPKPPKVLR